MLFGSFLQKLWIYIGASLSLTEFFCELLNRIFVYKKSILSKISLKNILILTLVGDLILLR